MKVLVTGGAGYIGSHAVYELIRAHHNVVVFDDLSAGNPEFVHPQAHFVQGDVTSADEVEALFETHGRFDVVMHFAAKVVVPESVLHPEEYRRVNVGGTKTLLAAMERYGCGRIIFSSTAAVYAGVGPDGLCRETDELAPQNPYGETKLRCEELLAQARERAGVQTGIFRYFNVAGADRSLKIGQKNDTFTHLIPRAIRAALGQSGPLTIYGDDYDTPDGSCIRDYVHVTDIALAHLMMAERLCAREGSLLMNLGSSRGYSVFEVIDEIEKTLPVPRAIGPRREGDPAVLIAATKRAQELLGWFPRYPLADIVASDLAFRRKDL